VEAIAAREHVTDPDGYLETLPDRLSNLGFVARASILGLLAFRFAFLASGANTASGFGGFIEGVSWFFAAPFATLFPSSSASPGVIEFSTLVAMVVYVLIFKLLGRLYRALAPWLSGGAGRRTVTMLWPSRRPAASTQPEPVSAAESTEIGHGHRRRYRMARARR
jgi:hypothetical protein